MTNSFKEKQGAQSQNKFAVFEDNQIRRVLHNGEWYFSIIDIVEVLTGSPNPRRYWSNLKIQLSENEGFVQLYPKTVQLKLKASDGKKYLTDTANTETILGSSELHVVGSWG
jgi:DNA-damage-inducible protein D